MGDVYQKGKVEFKLNSKVGNNLSSCAIALDDYRSWIFEPKRGNAIGKGDITKASTKEEHNEHSGGVRSNEHKGCLRQGKANPVSGLIKISEKF